MKKQSNTKITLLTDFKDSATYKRTLIHDQRLTNEEKGILIQLLDTKNFYISIRATAKWLKISEKHFNNVLKNLESFGYLNITKIGNQYIYEFKQESKYIPEFKPYLIETYTIEQLMALYENNMTPTKYKNYIKMVYDSINKGMESYQETINQIKKIELPKIDLKEEQEKQNEINIIDYLTEKKQ